MEWIHTEEHLSFFDKEDNFLDFLFVFLYTNHLKRFCNKKDRIFSQWGATSFRLEGPIFRRETKQHNKLPAPFKVYSFPSGTNVSHTTQMCIMTLLVLFFFEYVMVPFSCRDSDSYWFLLYMVHDNFSFYLIYLKYLGT